MTKTERCFDGEPNFETHCLPKLRAMPFFRLATDEEIDASYRAYVRCRAGGDFGPLCDVWQKTALATRADLGAIGHAYDRAGLIAPKRVSAHAFLASVRGVLAAGKRFRQRLRPATTLALETEFPWLEHRHEHIPDGWTPSFEFPAEFSEWLDVASLDDARARWQLVASLNEVQQAHYSADAAERFRLPELRAHAARERALAINYFGHWAPEATPALWRQTVILLDALNAAVFEMMCSSRAGEMISRALLSAVTRHTEWHAFVDGLGRPQRLL